MQLDDMSAHKAQAQARQQVPVRTIHGAFSRPRARVLAPQATGMSARPRRPVADTGARAVHG